MNIALFHYAYPPHIGGVEILMKRHAHILSELGYSVTVFTGSGREDNQKISLKEIPELQSLANIDQTLSQNVLEDRLIPEAFYRLSEKIQQILVEMLASMDVVIVHNMLTVHRNLPFVDAFKKYAAVHPEKKYIVWVHDHVFINEYGVDLEKVQLHDEAKNLVVRPIPDAQYVVISETLKQHVQTLMHIPDDTLHVIYNGLDYKHFFSIEDELWKKLNLDGLLECFPLCIAPVNIVRRKNLLYTIDVLDSLKRIYPDIRLVITGTASLHRDTSGYEQSVKEAIQLKGLERHVIFLGEQFDYAFSDEWLHTLYSLSDAIFYFSSHENFGLPMLEAFASRTPIFISDLPVFKELSEGYISRIATETTSAEETARIVHVYLEDNELEKRFRMVRQKFDIRRIIKEELLPLFS